MLSAVGLLGPAELFVGAGESGRGRSGHIRRVARERDGLVGMIEVVGAHGHVHVDLDLEIDDALERVGLGHHLAQVVALVVESHLAYLEVPRLLAVAARVRYDANAKVLAVVEVADGERLGYFALRVRFVVVEKEYALTMSSCSCSCLCVCAL